MRGSAKRQQESCSNVRIKTSIDSLRAVADNSELPQGRLHAMYALHGLGALDTDLILKRLDDDHAQLRRHAIRLSEQLPTSDALNRKLASMVKDDSIDVRYQLAFSIGSIDHPQRLDLLTELIRRDVQSPWVRLAVQSSLRSGAGEVFAVLAGDTEFRSA